MTPRREFGAALVLCAVAGALGLIAGGRSWLVVTVTPGDPLPPVTTTVPGAATAPMVSGLAVVVLAGVVGLLATRWWGRLGVGTVVALAGAGLLSVALPARGEPSTTELREVAFAAGLPAGEVTGQSLATGPTVAALAGVLAVLAGGLTIVRGRRWPRLGARYDAPTRSPDLGSRVGGAPGSPVGDGHPGGGAEPSGGDGPQPEDGWWAALDRGEDPTTRRSL